MPQQSIPMNYSLEKTRAEINDRHGSYYHYYGAEEQDALFVLLNPTPCPIDGCKKERVMIPPDGVPSEHRSWPHTDAMDTFPNSPCTPVEIYQSLPARERAWVRFKRKCKEFWVA